MVKLRVGYIVDDADQSFLPHDLYRRSLDSNFYAFEALIIQTSVRTKEKSRFHKAIHYIKQRGVKRFIDRLAFAFIEKLETLIVKRNPKFRAFFVTHKLDDFDLPKIYVKPNISPSGLVYRYNDDDINSIRRLNLDMLVRGGSGILRGEILDVCRYGIISFHHANNDINRGGPPGFWEVFNREASTGFIIQRLLSELDGGDVIFRGCIATSFLYKLNVCKLYIKSSVFLHNTIERIAREGRIGKIHNKSPYAYPLYMNPSAAQAGLYILKTFSHGAKKVFGKLTGKAFRWGVAYQFVEDWQSAVLWRSKVIKNPPYRFLADPFVVSYGGISVVYVEDYDYRTSKGKISAYEINPAGYKELGVALEEDFHLSYPFLFRDGDDLYMCPETHESKDIRLYKCVNFPLQWEIHKIILKNISAVDTNIFKYGDKYWMMTNIDSSGLGDHSSELHLFHADSFDSTEWVPHSMNPVVFDSQCTRNGGLILDSGNVYRVFQVPNFDRYGAMMGIAKIVDLSTEGYCEEVVSEIPPKFIKGIKGTHTFSFDCGALLVDFVKYESYRN